MCVLGILQYAQCTHHQQSSIHTRDSTNKVFRARQNQTPSNTYWKYFCIHIKISPFLWTEVFVESILLILMTQVDCTFYKHTVLIQSLTIKSNHVKFYNLLLPRLALLCWEPFTSSFRMYCIKINFQQSCSPHVVPYISHN